MQLNINKTATVDLKSKQNDSINYSIQILDENLNAVNFSGYTIAKMQLKENEFSTAIVTFHSTGSTYQIDISHLNNGTFILKANNTSAIPAGSYRYDVELSNATTKETVIEGQFQIESDITK